MQLSTRARYAVMAMVDLAARARCAVPTPSGACPSVCLSEIAASQQLSLAYLEQLFSKLRRAGLVTSMRGPGGGYRLARPDNEVPIAAIAAAVDEAIHATRCEVGEPGCMAGAGPEGTRGRCQTHDLWAELGRQIRLFLEGVTLADVIDGQVAGRAAPILTTTTATPPPLEGGGRGEGFDANLSPNRPSTPHDLAPAAATLAAE
jgi:Rrf2 family iron-sulfur cluster assembly transcriptional regulator